MASSGSFYSETMVYPGSGYTLYTKWLFSWEIVSQNASLLQTVISWKVTTRSSFHSDFSDAAGPGYKRTLTSGSKITVNGNAYSTPSTYTLANGDVAQQGQTTISHEADGTKTFSVSFGYKVGGNGVNCTGTSSFTLDALLLNPMIAYKANGSYKWGKPFIRVGGVYKKAIEFYKKDNGHWKTVSKRG